MASERSQLERRVFLLAPTVRDGQASKSVLQAAGIDCVVFDNLEALCLQIKNGVGAVMVSEETVNAAFAECLPAEIKKQPMWSDLPIILLTRTGAESPTIERALTTLGNVSLVE